MATRGESSERLTVSVGPEVGDVSSDPSKNKTELVVCTQVNKVSCVTVKEKQSWAVIKVVNHCGKVKDASGLSCAQSRIQRRRPGIYSHQAKWGVSGWDEVGRNLKGGGCCSADLAGVLLKAGRGNRTAGLVAILSKLTQQDSN